MDNKITTNSLPVCNYNYNLDFYRSFSKVYASRTIGILIIFLGIIIITILYLVLLNK